MPSSPYAHRPVLRSGRFVIGPVTTTSFILAIRSKRYNWNFRTTDLDRIVVTVSRKKNRLTLVAKSWGDNRVLKADIQVGSPRVSGVRRAQCSGV